jgi:pimeloyl-ACP methyl ester carboxylesterase
MPILTLPDAELHYEDVGTGAPLVLLHGLGGSGDDWAPEVAAFRERYRVITPDTRGCGRSRDREHPHGPFTIAQLGADLAALLDHLGTPSAHVLGWSLGGMIAFQLAVDAPALVSSLVIVNSGPDWMPKSALQRVALEMRGVVTSLMGPATMALVIAPKLFPKPEQAALRAVYVERMGRNDKRTYAALLAAFLGWSVADRLPSLGMPTLVVASDGDYTSVASKEAWARTMPNARLVVVPDARHALPIEAPERLDALVAEFLESLALAPARDGAGATLT